MQIYTRNTLVIGLAPTPNFLWVHLTSEAEAIVSDEEEKMLKDSMVAFVAEAQQQAITFLSTEEEIGLSFVEIEVE